MGQEKQHNYVIKNASNTMLLIWCKGPILIKTTAENGINACNQYFKIWHVRSTKINIEKMGLNQVIFQLLFWQFSIVPLKSLFFVPFILYFILFYWLCQKQKTKQNKKTNKQTDKQKERWQGHRNSCGQLQLARILIKNIKEKLQLHTISYWTREGTITITF